MSVSEKLQKFMDEKGYSKADVSRLSGIPYTTIDGLFKKGDDNTKLSTLKKLAKLIGCGLDELADDNLSSPETAQLAAMLRKRPGLVRVARLGKNLSDDNLNQVVEYTEFLAAKSGGGKLTDVDDDI